MNKKIFLNYKIILTRQKTFNNYLFLQRYPYKLINVAEMELNDVVRFR